MDTVMKILDWPNFLPFLFKDDFMYWVAVGLAVVCILSTLFYIFACFIHRCVMNYVLLLFAILWSLFAVLLLVGLLIKNQLMLKIWLHASTYILLVMIILIIVYSAHCCCCCIEPNGCGITMLIIAIIFYLVAGILFLIIVNCVRLQFAIKDMKK